MRLQTVPLIAPILASLLIPFFAANASDRKKTVLYIRDLRTEILAQSPDSDDLSPWYELVNIYKETSSKWARNVVVVTILDIQNDGAREVVSMLQERGQIAEYESRNFLSKLATSYPEVRTEEEFESDAQRALKLLASSRGALDRLSPTSMDLENRLLIQRSHVFILNSLINYPDDSWSVRNAALVEVLLSISDYRYSNHNNSPALGPIAAAYDRLVSEDNLVNPEQMQTAIVTLGRMDETGSGTAEEIESAKEFVFQQYKKGFEYYSSLDSETQALLLQETAYIGTRGSAEFIFDFVLYGITSEVDLELDSEFLWRFSRSGFVKDNPIRISYDRVFARAMERAGTTFEALDTLFEELTEGARTDKQTEFTETEVRKNAARLILVLCQDMWPNLPRSLLLIDKCEEIADQLVPYSKDSALEPRRELREAIREIVADIREPHSFTKK